MASGLRWHAILMSFLISPLRVWIYNTRKVAMIEDVVERPQPSVPHPHLIGTQSTLQQHSDLTLLHK